MSSDQAAAAPKAAEAQSLPSRPAKQPKEKAPKGGKSAGLEVGGRSQIPRRSTSPAEGPLR